MNHSKDAVCFDNAPVVEVTVGIGFEALQCWDSAAPSAFLPRVPLDNPQIQIQMPLAPLVFGAEGFQIAIGQGDIAPRTWYVTPDGSQLVQIQNNRLHANWRKSGDEDTYPRFVKLKTLFDAVLKGLTQFADERHEALRPTAFEMTYINHFISGEIMNGFGDTPSVFRAWFAPPRTDNEITSIQGSYQMKLGEDAAISVQANTARRVRDDREIVVLNLTGTGRIAEFSQLDAAVDQVRRVQLNIFRELTTVHAQSCWGIRNA